MKKVFLIMALMIGLSSINLHAQKPIKLKFSYIFTHVVKGYDHISRMRVYLDDALIGTSPEKKESKKNGLTVTIDPGMHSLRAVVETKYETLWEEHIVANEYSVDCIYQKSFEFLKNMNIQLEFNIEKGETIIKKEY